MARLYGRYVAGMVALGETVPDQRLWQRHALSGVRFGPKRDRGAVEWIRSAQPSKVTDVRATSLLESQSRRSRTPSLSPVARAPLLTGDGTIQSDGGRHCVHPRTRSRPPACPPESDSTTLGAALTAPSTGGPL